MCESDSVKSCNSTVGVFISLALLLSNTTYKHDVMIK